MNIDQGNRGIRSYGANKLTSFGIFLVLRVRNPQIWSYQLGAYSEGGRGACLSQSSIEWVFTEKHPALFGLFSLPEVFCGPQMCQKCVGGRGSALDPAGEAHDAPQTP